MTQQASHTPANVVIMNMHYTGLGIARDLRGTGAQVYGLSFSKNFFGYSSNCCRPSLFPNSETEPEETVDYLINLAQTLSGPAILLPTRDHDINLIMKFRDRLEQHYAIPFPATDVWLNTIDKDNLYKAADLAEVSYPSVHLILSMADLEKHKDGFTFPSLIKPVQSSDWRQAGVWEAVGRQKAILVNSFNELYENYERIHQLAPRAHVQQYIDGPEQDIVVFGSYRNEEKGILDYFTGRKIIQYPAGSGTGVVVAAEVLPDIIDMSKRLLKTLRYQGISEIEYKYHRGDNKYYLIEINGRHWDQHRLGAASGVNLSASMYRDVTGQTHLEQNQATKSRYWIADDTFWVSLLTDLMRRNNAIGHYFRALRGPRVWAVLDWRDLRPYAKALKSLFGVLSNLVRAKFR